MRQYHVKLKDELQWLVIALAFALAAGWILLRLLKFFRI
jgi:hypothetical protein